MCGVGYVYICVYTTIIVEEKEAMVLKGSKENKWDGLGKKGKVRHGVIIFKLKIKMKKTCWTFAFLPLFFCSIKPPCKDRKNFNDYG